MLRRRPPPRATYSVIGRATLAFLISVLLDPMSRIIGAKALPDGIGEDNAQKRERSGGGPSPASHTRESMFPGFHARRGCALADLIVESFDIKARDRCHFQIAKQRLYVALNAPSIGCQRRRLLSELPTSKDAPGLAGLKVTIAQFRYRLSPATLSLLFGGVGAFRDDAENATGFSPSQVWRQKHRGDQ